MYLATTAITEFWNKNDRILLLGKWCLLYDKRNEWQNLDYEIFPYPWDDREKVKEAYRYCRRVYQHIMIELSDFMNVIHDVKYDKRYWQIFLGSWLFAYIGRVYERYSCLQEAFEKYPDLTTIILHPDCYYTPLTNSDDVVSSTGDFRNLQIYSQVLAMMGSQFPTRAIKDPMGLDTQVNAGSCKMKDAKRLLQNSLGSFVRRYLHKRVKLLVHSGIPRNILIKSMIRSRLKILPFTCSTYDNGYGVSQLENRHQIGKLHSRDEFEGILLRTMVVNTPRIYIENYLPALKCILAEIPVQPISLLLPDVHFNEMGKIFAAEQHMRGGRLVGAQHGGGYGIFEMLENETLELEMVNKYYSWGWNTQDKSSKIKPMPSIAAMKAKRQKLVLSERKGILLVLTDLPRYFYRFVSQPLGPQLFTHFEWTKLFISALPIDLLPLLRVRPYMKDYGLGMKDCLLKEFDSISFDDPNIMPLHESVQKSRITIIDHSATTFLETLAADHPTIIFWNPSFFEVRKETEPYFEALCDVDIFHKTPESAAKHLNKVYEKIDDWWDNRDLQMARQNFVDRYAFCPEDGLDRWITELTGLERDNSKAFVNT